MDERRLLGPRAGEKIRDILGKQMPMDAINQIKEQNGLKDSNTTTAASSLCTHACTRHSAAISSSPFSQRTPHGLLLRDSYDSVLLPLLVCCFSLFSTLALRVITTRYRCDLPPAGSPWKIEI